jgi:Lon protease-like protein
MTHDDLTALENFNGTARLFPLPNLVLFPFVMQALHIFEPRYRQMTAEALAGDRLIALVLLQPGWEADYEGRPPVAKVACLGRIMADQQLQDGRYNLHLRGLSRVRILHEVDTGKPYRTARVELLQDEGIPAPGREVAQRRKLVRLLPAWCPSQGPMPELLQKLLQSNLPVGTVADVLAFTLPLPLEEKQALLEAVNVGQRVDRLIHFLEANKPGTVAEAADRSFPPEFSTN